MLAKIGVKANIKPFERAAHRKTLIDGNFNLFDYYWAFALDPDETIYPELHSGESWNWGKWNNPELDKLVEDARVTLESLVDRPDLPALPSGLIGVQSSVAINSRLTFDLGQVPASVVINKAEIFITPDSVSSIKGSSSNNSLRLSYLSYADSLNTEGNPSFLSFKDNKYSGDVTLFVRNWISRKENNGILIEAGSPTSGLDFFALKGSDYSEISERPRLRITYTVR